MEEDNIQKQAFRKGILCGFIIMLILSAVAVGLLRWAKGNAFVNRSDSHTVQEIVSDKATREKLQDLADIIDIYYYEDVKATEIEEGIYSGLLSSMGDPYSQYYNQEDYRDLMDTTTGSYCGIGALLTQDINTMQVTVLHVYKGTPAEEAGIKDGDILLTIDGTEADSEELSELVKRIKGEEGTSVHVTVQRGTGDELLELDVARRKIEVPTVEYQLLEEQIGYLQISEFSDLTAEQFAAAAADLESQGMTGLIVDVRDNPGGVLDGVSAVLDQILPEGIVVYTEDKYGNRQDYISSGESCMELPMVVLINENSASASEIFAGAIKDYEYGTLIGTTTFGKGIVQQIIPLEDGSAVKVTIARYFTPKGNYIHEVGIEPDIELEYEYLNPEDTEYNPLHDNQVQKALEVLINQ